MVSQSTGSQSFSHQSVGDNRSCGTGRFSDRSCVTGRRFRERWGEFLDDVFPVPLCSVVRCCGAVVCSASRHRSRNPPSLSASSADRQLGKSAVIGSRRDQTLRSVLRQARQRYFVVIKHECLQVSLYQDAIFIYMMLICS